MEVGRPARSLERLYGDGWDPPVSTAKRALTCSEFAYWPRVVFRVGRCIDNQFGEFRQKHRSLNGALNKYRALVLIVLSTPDEPVVAQAIQSAGNGRLRNGEGQGKAPYRMRRGGKVYGEHEGKLPSAQIRRIATNAFNKRPPPHVQSLLAVHRTPPKGSFVSYTGQPYPIRNPVPTPDLAEGIRGSGAVPVPQHLIGGTDSHGLASLGTAGPVGQVPRHQVDMEPRCRIGYKTF